MGLHAFFFRHLKHRCCHGWMMRRLARKLRLNEQQSARLGAVHENLERLREEAKEGWNYQRTALLDLLSHERLDRDEALRLAQVPTAMVNDALPRMVEAFAGFYDDLSAEQRNRLREMFRARNRCCC